MKKCEHPIDWPCPICHPTDTHPKPKKYSEMSDKEIEWYQDGMEMIGDYLRAKGRI